MAGRGRGKKRFSSGPTRQRRPESPTPSDQSQSQPASESSESSAPPPFFNTTFSTHRVSPLHVGAQPLTRQRLQVLSYRLRDLVVGDVVRGVEVGLDGDDTIMPRAGTLERVDISWARLGDVLGLDSDSGGGGRPPSRDLSSDAVDPRDSWDGAGEQLVRRAASGRALHVSLRYENALCTAVLLPSLLDADDAAADGDYEAGDSGAFLALPLLLVRMPAPLRPIVIDFLSTTFDCRVSPLRLGTRSLVTSLERWMKAARPSANEPVTKDVVLSLGFNIPAPETRGDPETDEAAHGEMGLRAVDVIVPASELDTFHSAGSRLPEPTRSAAAGSKRKPGWEEDLTKRRKLAGRLYEEGWDWRRGVVEKQPFVEALGRYFDGHLALNLFDPRVRVTRIACGGFVMSEGRVKIFPPAEKGGVEDAAAWSTGQMRAVVDLLEILVGKAMARVPDGGEID